VVVVFAVFAGLLWPITDFDAPIVGRVALIFIFLLIGSLYLLPSIVARQEGHPYKEGIAALSLFLGWTLIGWVAALNMGYVPTWKIIALPSTSGVM
jgi:hypothetical protein